MLDVAAGCLEGYHLSDQDLETAERLTGGTASHDVCASDLRVAGSSPAAAPDSVFLPILDLGWQANLT
jgi:hypothetical protein